MAVDIATLGIKVDASEADQGKHKLDALAQSGDKAERSTKGLATTSGALRAALAQVVGAINSNTSALNNYASGSDRAAASTRSASSATDEMASRVTRLKASVDPLGTAQARVNSEMAEARMLFESGAIGAGEYGNAMRVLQGRATDLAARQEALNTRIRMGGSASKLTASEALNLSRQFADVGVTAAMGMNPLMILIQQGPQIADIMKTSGLGFRGLAMETLRFFKIIETVPAANAAVIASEEAVAAANATVVVSNLAVAATSEAAVEAEGQLAFAFMAEAEAANLASGATARAAAANAAAAGEAEAQTGAMVTRLGIVGRLAGPVALVLGGIWLGFIAGARGANESAAAVQREFGFTREQMKRLKDANTELGYSFSDVWGGIKEVVKGTLEDIFGTGYLSTLESYWNSFLDSVVSGVSDAVQSILSSFLGTYHAIVNVWGMLPTVMGNIVASVVNAVAHAVADMVNSSIDGINGLIGMLPDWVTSRTGQINYRMNVNEMPTQSAGGFMEGIHRGWDEGDAQATGIVNTAGERFRRGRTAHRRQRLQDAAGDAPAGRHGARPRMSDEERDYNQAVTGSENYIKALREETAEIGKNELETRRLQMARQQAIITQAAAALGTTEAMEKARRLTAEMAQVEDEWEQATVNNHLRELRLELNDQADALRHETSLIGMNNEAREVANAQREIELRLRTLARQGTEITADMIERETAAILANAHARGQRTDATEAAQRMATHMRDNANAIRETTAAFGELFGTAGEGFANLLNTVLDFDARQAESRARLIELQEQYNNGQMSETAYTFERGRVNEQMANAQLAHYGDMIGAAKSFFTEGSTGWRILEGAERAYRIFQFAMQIKSMLMDRASTVSSVANSGARAAADGVAAIAKAIASLPFPLNIVAGAATAAALIAFGVKVLGGKGGGSSKSASASASDSVAAYKGPVDEYGAPASGYSVLKPGATTVAANDNRLAPGSGSSGAGGGTTVIIEGDKLNIQGGADQRTVNDMAAMLEARDKALTENIRQTVAADQAAKGSRQRIGGS